MKILVDDSISSVEARDLGFYLGSSSHHKPENALNDIPSVEWVGGYPKTTTTVNISDLGRIYVETDFKIFGRGALGSFYFGKFTADRLSMTIRHNIDMSNCPAGQEDSYEEPTVETRSYPFANHDSFDPVHIPIRVYSTISDFVRGKFSRYHDYFRTLSEVNFKAYELHDPSLPPSALIPDPNDITATYPNKHVTDLSYIARDYEIKLKFVMENQNILQMDSVKFEVEESKKISGFEETIDGIDYEYVELIGRFRDTSNNYLSYDDKFTFIENLDVGSYVIGGIVSSSATPKDLFQIIRIKGNGNSVKSISLISRKIKTDSLLLPTNTPQTTDASTGNTLLSIHTILRSLRLGLVRCGFYEDFPNAQVGLSKSYKDFSVRTDLVNGGHQYINRNVSKNYSGNMILDRTRVIKFLKFAEKQRAKPFPVEVLTGMEEESPSMLFCVLSDMPQENMSYRTGVLREISFNLKQIH